MPRYLYSGPRTAISLPPASEGQPPQEVALVPHQEVELPAELPYVQRLVGKGQLVAIAAEPEAEAEPKPTRSRTTRTTKEEGDS
ncbi:hypothetical protein [Pseudanabaena sp. FACHB-2040]|uniref:hypothetical protein n=1 Tax=Pseudanabaena sp. FACHB-2040 TaxID=2692859 RepID=UPI001685AF88|nr:hypothetical protein [Pseudanabaena sp. FACHB-2040]MBD2261371.1 hypothetical protein [Pseudanabaena sp. FACHB-2040]